MIFTEDYQVDSFIDGYLCKTCCYTHQYSDYTDKLPFALGSFGIHTQSDKFYTKRQGLDELYFCLTISGLGELEYRGKKFTVNPGDAFLIDCMEPHFYKTHGSAMWVALWVHFTGTGARPFYETLYPKNAEYSVMRNTNMNNFTEIQARLMSSTGIGDYRARCLSFMQILTDLVILCDNEQHKMHETLCVPFVYSDLIKFISENYASQISVKELAEKSGYSEVQFSRNFVKYFGITPYQYIIHIRLQNAAQLLRVTDYPVEYIGTVTNFSSTSNFISQFTKNYGMTPKKYRDSFMINEKRG